MSQKLIPPLFAVFLFFVCTSLGILSYIPGYKLRAGFEGLFSTFALTGRGVILTLGAVVIIALVAGLVGALFFGWQFSLATRIKVRLRAAEADQVERDAIAPHITVAKPGHQIIAHEYGGHTPVHLIGGRRWELHTLAHATVKRPEIIGNQIAPALPAPWPAKVNLFDLLPDGRGDLNNIVLGVTNEGQAVSEGLGKLVHVAVGGGTGWGKSEFLRSFGYQVATAPEPAELALIDPEAATFSPFVKSDRLRYPIVGDNEQDVLAVLGDLQDEMTRRKELFSRYPEADKLSVYNHVADEPLPVVVLMIDEITTLLGHKDIERAIRSIVLRSRKYGLFTVAGGQSWKASDFDSSVRAQFSSTVHFHARDKTSSRVLLGDPAAADLDRVGGAFALLPGRPLVEIQGPALSLMSVIKALSGTTFEPPEMPVAPEPARTRNGWNIDLVLEMLANGDSLAAIARANGKTPGGRQNEKIRAIGADMGMTSPTR